MRALYVCTHEHCSELEAELKYLYTSLVSGLMFFFLLVFRSLAASLTRTNSLTKVIITITTATTLTTTKFEGDRLTGRKHIANIRDGRRYHILL